MTCNKGKLLLFMSPGLCWWCFVSSYSIFINVVIDHSMALFHMVLYIHHLILLASHDFTKPWKTHLRDGRWHFALALDLMEVPVRKFFSLFCLQSFLQKEGIETGWQKEVFLSYVLESWVFVLLFFDAMEAISKFFMKMAVKKKMGDMGLDGGNKDGGILGGG